MSLLDDYRRLHRHERCVICDHTGWCMTSRDDPPSKAICARVESGRRWGDAGWVHRLRDDGWRPQGRLRSRTINVGKEPDGSTFEALALEYGKSLEPESLDQFAKQLGVTAASLERLGVGWTGSCWSFPMRSADGSIRGIRLRRPNGRKFAVKGGREGLFIPRGLAGTGPLLLPEGPTDTAAALDLGFDAVGRPSCSTGHRLARAFVRLHRPAQIAVVADGDAPGQAGAATLARSLAAYCRDVRVITPPAKDLREWLRSGATPKDVQQAMEAARSVFISIQRSGGQGR